MTELLPEVATARRPEAEDASLARALNRARWVILWERLWPPVAAIATVIGLFLAVSWFGLWLWLPPMGRAIGLSLFALLGLAALVPLLRLRWPARRDVLRRLDLGLAHRPATALTDNLASSESDAWSKALWRAHLERALAAATRLKVGLPAPRLPARDPLALRALVTILAVAAFFAAGSDRMRRVAAAFDWQGVVTPANFRLDAWVSPPLYTGKPPVILPGVRAGERTQISASPVNVPAGSVLVIRASGQARFDVVASGGLTEAAADPRQPAGTEEKRFTIAGSGSAALRGVGRDDVSWSFNAIPDKPPSIALTKDPEPQARGALKLSYKIEDDYGAVEAKAEFALKDSAEARPLYGPPDMALVLPQARTRIGAAHTLKDLSDHPWAGAEVNLTLMARDEANNEGRSAPVELRLPERIFVKPLARALIEQRRELALDAETRDRVLIAIDALAIAPEKFTPEVGTYLGLRSLYWSLARARSDDELRAVVQQIWAMATQLEDGNVSDAEARLRQAQEALRQALERGASEEEIKKLMEELRAALNKFLQALAEEMRKNPELARPLDRNSQRELRSQDLKSMLDRLEQLARQGNKSAAQQLLDQLRQMLENLQMARPGQQGDGDDDMMSALDELGNMIREQQRLRDRTFREGQEQRRQRSEQERRGERGDPNAFNDLKQNQQALRDRLKKLLDEMKQKGLSRNPGDQQGAQPGDPLGEAGEAMGDAEGALGEGNADSAVEGQGRALDAMRKGAQGLAQQLQQQMGQGPGMGRPGGPQNRAQGETDPLGRPLRGRDYGDDNTVKVPGEIAAERARRILEELRRRFGESLRPQLELDYIERLLKDY